MDDFSSQALFTLHEKEHITLEDGELCWYPAFLSAGKCQEYFQHLEARTAWQQDQIRMHGKLLPVPRLQAWYGDQSTHYSYSGIALRPRPFTPLLAQLKATIETASDCKFNSVLLNYYRHGNDSVSWHSDNEKELGPDPLIASLSLGCSRRFELKHKTKKTLQKCKLELNSGSLLIMGKGLQENWLHQVPKQVAIQEARINLTFRFIQ